MASKKYVFTLRSDAKPHLYITQITDMIKKDGYLSEQMRNVLKLMKKTRMPYVILGTVKELIVVEDLEINLERALTPQLTGYIKTDWSDNDKKEYKTSKETFYKSILKIYEDIGYKVAREEPITKETVDGILKLLPKEKEKWASIFLEV